MHSMFFSWSKKKSMGLNLGRINVHLALSNRVPNLWIGSAGPVLWPPRRPAVTLMDFYFGAMLKNCSIEEILNLYHLTQRSATAFFLSHSISSNAPWLSWLLVWCNRAPMVIISKHTKVPTKILFSSLKQHKTFFHYTV